MAVAHYLKTQYYDIQVSYIHHVDIHSSKVCPSLPCSLYLGNPMDPPDVLGSDPNATRPTQLPGRAKSE